MKLEDAETVQGAATRSWSASGRFRYDADQIVGLQSFEEDEGTLDPSEPEALTWTGHLTSENLAYAGFGAMMATAVLGPMGFFLFL